MPQPPEKWAPTASTARVPVAVLLPPALKGQHQPSAGQSVDVYGLTVPAACRLVAVFTRQGDLVINTDASPTMAAAAEWLGRRTSTTVNATPTATTSMPAALVIARLPLPSAADLCGVAEWMRHTRRDLSRGGYLVTAVHTEDGYGGWAHHAATVIAAARTVGLAYRQHLVTVHTPLSEDGAHSAARLRAGRHVRVHTDLYVFQPHGGDARG